VKEKLSELSFFLVLSSFLEDEDKVEALSQWLIDPILIPFLLSNKNEIK